MAILERINYQIATGFDDLKKKFIKGDVMPISKYLDERLVVFLNEELRDEAILRLVEVLDSQGRLSSKEKFHSAILEREKIVSTGIGIGVAIPHAKLEGCKEFFIAVGIQRNQGIDWRYAC